MKRHLVVRLLHPCSGIVNEVEGWLGREGLEASLCKVDGAFDTVHDTTAAEPGKKVGRDQFTIVRLRYRMSYPYVRTVARQRWRAMCIYISRVHVFVLDVCSLVAHPELPDSSQEQLLRFDGHTGLLRELCLDFGRTSILLARRQMYAQETVHVCETWGGIVHNNAFSESCVTKLRRSPSQNIAAVVITGPGVAINSCTTSSFFVRLK